MGAVQFATCGILTEENENCTFSGVNERQDPATHLWLIADLVVDPHVQ